MQELQASAGILAKGLPFSQLLMTELRLITSSPEPRWETRCVTQPRETVVVRETSFVQQSSAAHAGFLDDLRSFCSQCTLQKLEDPLDGLGNLFPRNVPYASSDVEGEPGAFLVNRVLVLEKGNLLCKYLESRKDPWF